MKSILMITDAIRHDAISALVLLILLTVVFIVMMAMLNTVLVSLARVRKYASYRTGTRKAATGPDGQPPEYGGRQLAEGVFLYANKDYYQFLLSELQDGLEEEGYAMTTDPDRRVALSHSSRQRLAGRLFIARERYVAPFQPDRVVDEKAQECSRNGYSSQWLSWLIRGCETQGWFITLAIPERCPPAN